MVSLCRIISEWFELVNGCTLDGCCNTFNIRLSADYGHEHKKKTYTYFLPKIQEYIKYVMQLHPGLSLGYF